MAVHKIISVFIAGMEVPAINTLFKAKTLLIKIYIIP